MVLQNTYVHTYIYGRLFNISINQKTKALTPSIQSLLLLDPLVLSSGASPYLPAAYMPVPSDVPAETSPGPSVLIKCPVITSPGSFKPSPTLSLASLNNNSVNSSQCCFSSIPSVAMAGFLLLAALAAAFPGIRRLQDLYKMQ